MNVPDMEAIPMSSIEWYHTTNEIPIVGGNEAIGERNSSGLEARSSLLLIHLGHGNTKK